MYVINSFGAGGAERHLLALARHMVCSGHTVRVVALTGIVSGGAKNIADDFISIGAQIEILDRAGYGLPGDVRRWWKLRKLAAAWTPDILHSHLPRADLAASFVKRTLPGTIWISTVHDAYIKGVYSGYWVFRWLSWNWLIADHIIAVSGHARQWVFKNLRLPEAKTSIIYHGIAKISENFRPRLSIPEDGSPFMIGCLARFEPRKGIATLIKAMTIICENYPRARLLIAGSDPCGYASEMRKLADMLHVGHAVEIQGFCDAPFDFLRRLNTFAFASESEGFGIVLLEAMMVGLPVVASDIYPLNHIVLNGETGIMAHPNNPQSFAAAITDLMANPELAYRMGEAGHHRCLHEFSEEKMVQSTENLYRNLANRPRGTNH